MNGIGAIISNTSVCRVRMNVRQSGGFERPVNFTICQHNNIISRSQRQRKLNFFGQQIFNRIALKWDHIANLSRRLYCSYFSYVFLFNSFFKEGQAHRKYWRSCVHQTHAQKIKAKANFFKTTIRTIEYNFQQVLRRKLYLSIEMSQ